MNDNFQVGRAGETMRLFFEKRWTQLKKFPCSSTPQNINKQSNTNTYSNNKKEDSSSSDDDNDGDEDGGSSSSSEEISSESESSEVEEEDSENDAVDGSKS